MMELVDKACTGGMEDRGQGGCLNYFRGDTSKYLGGGGG